MLAKCANPECSHVFRYFGTGKLFRLSQRQTHRKCTGESVEHFWLCADCAPKMTIAVERDGEMIVISRTLVPAYREMVGRISWVPEVSPALLAQAAQQSEGR